MIEPTCIQRMHAQTRKHTQLDTVAWRDFVSLFRPFNLAKGSHPVLPGDDTSRLYFVCRGLLRYYFTAEDGKEWNKAFVEDGNLTVSLSEDFLGYPSPYAVQALEESTLLWASYADFRALFERHASIDRFGRCLIEQLLVVKLARERSFLQHNASSRYLDFLRQHPRLARRIPQYHLASYLGISEVALSRLRNQLSSLA